MTNRKIQHSNILLPLLHLVLTISVVSWCSGNLVLADTMPLVFQKSTFDNQLSANSVTNTYIQTPTQILFPLETNGS